MLSTILAYISLAFALIASLVSACISIIFANRARKLRQTIAELYKIAYEKNKIDNI